MAGRRNGQTEQSGDAARRGKQVDIPDRAKQALQKKTLCAEWGIKPWEQHKLTARDMQDISLAEHAETYLEQVKQRQQSSTGSVQTKSGLEHRSSKRKRIEAAKTS